MKSAAAVSPGLRELTGLPVSLGARGHGASDLPASAVGRGGQGRSGGQRAGPPAAPAARPSLRGAGARTRSPEPARGGRAPASPRRRERPSSRPGHWRPAPWAGQVPAPRWCEAPATPPRARGAERPGACAAPRLPAFPPSLPETRPRPCGRARPRRVKRLRAPALRHGALGPPGRSAPPVRAPVTETPGSTRPHPVCGRSSPCESVPPTRGDPSPCASAVLPSVLRLVTASLPAVPASPWPSRRGLRTPSRCGWTPRPSSSLVWPRNPDGSPHSPGPRRPPPRPPGPKEGIFDCEKPEEARSARNCILELSAECSSSVCSPLFVKVTAYAQGGSSSD